MFDMSFSHISRHVTYAYMYIFICHLISEVMADGLQGYIEYQKRSIKIETKYQKEKEMLKM